MRELIFTEDIHKANGEIKFFKGEARTLPPPTWRELANQIGKPLNAFTAEPRDFFRGMELNTKEEQSRPRLKAKKE